LKAALAKNEASHKCLVSKMSADRRYGLLKMAR
jgi:hypothetical protein